MREIHRSPVDSPHKGPVTRKMFPFIDVLVYAIYSIDFEVSKLGDTYIHRYPDDKDLRIDTDYISIRRDSVGSMSNQRRSKVLC